MLREENRGFKETIEAKDQQINGANSDWATICEQNEELKYTQLTLLSRLQYLHEIAFPSTKEQEKIVFPDTLDEIEEWCNQYLPQKLALSGKAKRAIKDSQFEDIGLIYNALLVYANEYREMRMRDSGDAEIRNKYFKRLEGLGLEDCGIPISETRRGERENVYSFEYEGQTYPMEHHIGRGGGNFDPRHCLRIYSYWDTESNRVLIGSLPEHLDLRISN